MILAISIYYKDKCNHTTQLVYRVSRLGPDDREHFAVCLGSLGLQLEFHGCAIMYLEYGSMF